MSQLSAAVAKVLLTGGLALLFAASGLSGAHASAERVVYTFQGGRDGANPYAGLINVQGSLYGTTFDGGDTSCDDGSGGSGCGTVFRLTPPAVAGGAWTETVLYSFHGGSDSATPRFGVLNVGDTLYGTTTGEVNIRCSEGTCGAVFKLTPPAVTGGVWTETVLYDFRNRSTADLIKVNGRLYGTASGLGGGSGGTVFQMTRKGVERELHSFSSGSDGSDPNGLLNVGGTLYGTGYFGGGKGCYGGFGCGTVFELTPPGTVGSPWHFEVLYSFKGGDDGAYPFGKLINVGGTLYGTTVQGGGTGCGFGGARMGCGTVFELAPPTVTGGAWTESVLHAFTGGPDGAAPQTGLLYLRGSLYGTTFEGGRGLGRACFAGGCGTIFKLTPPVVTGGTWTETVLHDFSGGSDGFFPLGDLIDVGGTLYGTTAGGIGCSGGSCGTVFEIRP